MQEGLFVTVAGMGIVFVSLGALLLVILILGRFITSKGQEEGEEEKR